MHRRCEGSGGAAAAHEPQDQRRYLHRRRRCEGSGGVDAAHEPRYRGINSIGADDAKALAALAQLTSLEIGFRNDIGADGAKALAALTRLTSLGIDGSNSIGAEAQLEFTVLPNRWDRANK